MYGKDLIDQVQTEIGEVDNNLAVNAVFWTRGEVLVALQDVAAEVSAKARHLTDTTAIQFDIADPPTSPDDVVSLPSNFIDYIEGHGGFLYGTDPIVAATQAQVAQYDNDWRSVADGPPIAIIIDGFGPKKFKPYPVPDATAYFYLPYFRTAVVPTDDVITALEFPEGHWMGLRAGVQAALYKKERDGRNSAMAATLYQIYMNTIEAIATEAKALRQPTYRTIQKRGHAATGLTMRIPFGTVTL